MYTRIANNNPQFFSEPQEENLDVIEKRSFHSFTKSGYPLYRITLMRDVHLKKENGIKIIVSSKETLSDYWENTGLPIELFMELKEMIESLQLGFMKRVGK